jgi:5S rRNA maturation endonuclease (ribonuclease M5)
MRLKQYIETHLEARDIDLKDQKKYPIYVDKEEDVAYFPLFNLSGKFLGYQRYNPKGAKGTASAKLPYRDKKYHPIISKEDSKKNIYALAVYGLHTLDKRNYVFVVEGIFDAVKLIKLGEPVIAVLSNDPKPLKNFFFILQKKVIVIADNDKAGKKLKKIGNISLTTPDPYKDVGEMPVKELKDFIKGIKR